MSRKQFFSLIEIAVAMAVAAIGVAAIMALLPIAVKSTSDSVGDTLAADAANTVIAQLDRAAWEHFDWIQSLPTSKPSSFKDDDRINYANELLGSESYKILPDNNAIATGKFAFLFGPPGKKGDFAAEVLCWRSTTTSLKMTSIDTSSGKPKTITSAEVKHPEKNSPVLLRVFIEISWPLSKPYKDTSGKVFPRQSRTFVREYFDPTYYKPETN